ncbi:hypothetical protein [Streptomyces cathayae]|nr:hypothetical protein [Streptomyces sp. HUAS 5]WGD38705.1 hypothetical protein PYS65_00085 [Streptomyces sp. HUAS 5]
MQQELTTLAVADSGTVVAHGPAAFAGASALGDAASGPRGSAVRPSAGLAAAKEPKLRELIVEELRCQARPLSSSEVTAVLRRAHPGRRLKEPAMRRALEALVGQERVQRRRRGGRVLYSVADAVAVVGGAAGLSLVADRPAAGHVGGHAAAS